MFEWRNLLVETDKWTKEPKDGTSNREYGRVGKAHYSNKTI